MGETQEQANGIIQIKNEQLAPLIKRCIQISIEVSDLYTKETLLELNIEELSSKFKYIALEYNCYIITNLSNDGGQSQAYNATKFDTTDDNSYGLIFAETEAASVIGAFKWLADKGYFIKEYKC